MILFFMNKKLTLILLTNLVITGPMVTDASASIDPEEQFLLAPQIELSPAKQIDQLMQQVNILTGNLKLLVGHISDMNKELGTLRKQIEKESRTAESQTDDLMPHKTNALIQADGLDTFMWDGIGKIPQDVTKVRIADGVTSIKNHAFWECKSLEKIVIPNSVTSIGDYAFMRCTGLKSIIMPSRFKGQEGRLCIPAGCTITYN